MTIELLWSMLVKGSTIVGVCFVANLMLRKSSAAKRHAVWLGAVFALLLLPCAAVRMPNWSVDIERTHAIAPLAVPQTLREKIPQTTAPSTSIQPMPRSNFRAPAERTELDWGSVLPKIWFAGCLLTLIYSLIGHLRVAILVRSSRIWKAEGLGLRPNQLRLTADLKIPATCGFFRPIILLPEGADLWDQDQLRMVVAHELGHIRRADWICQIVAQLVASIHFFNPLAWLVARQLRKESEYACDDFVLLQGIEPTAYAHLLLQVARVARCRLALPTVGMAQTDGVEDRLKAICDSTRPRSISSKRIVAPVLAVSALICLPLAALRAQHSDLTRKFGELPPIPRVESAQRSSNHFESSRWIASLPNGFRVRLVGVSAPQDFLWGADGLKLPDSDRWSRGDFFRAEQFHRWTWGINPKDRYFYIEAQAPATGEATLSYQTGDDDIPRARRTKLSYSHDLVQFQSGKPQFAKIDLNELPDRKSILFRVGVAAGWQTVATVRNPYRGPAEGIVPTHRDGGSLSQGCGIMLDGTPEIFYQYSPGRYKRTKIIPYHLDNSISRRVLAFDDQGRAIPLPKDDRIDLDPKVFCRIGKLVLQTSAVQWAEFHDVPVKPHLEWENARRLDRGIHGVAKGIDPAFIRHLSNGVKVSLSSVTTAARDGSLWRFSGQPSWQPGGEILQQPQTPDKEATLTPSNGQSMPVFFRVQYDGLPTDANTVVRTSTERRTAFERDPNRCAGPSRPGPMSRLAYFSPEERSTSVKVGVATGPWRTACIYHVNPTDLAGSDRGISAELGSNPVICVGSQKADLNMATTPIEDVSMRIVAVTKGGKEKVLGPSAWRSYGPESFTIPSKSAEAYSVNGICAEDVQSLRIEIRPYEWASFPEVSLTPKN